MANRLKMAKVQTILALRSRDWSLNSLSHAEFLELALQVELAVRDERLMSRRISRRKQAQRWARRPPR